MKNLTLLLIFFFCFSTTTLSQNPQWIVYDTTNSGLPYNVVDCIAIDESNNKWIGTPLGGVAKFDDTSWEVYDTLNSGLPENYAGCIAVDKSNNIWMGNSNRSDGFGLVNYDGTNWTVYDTTNSGLPSNQTHWIVTDELNNKWIGTDKGLAKFDGMDWVVYNQSNSGLPNNWVWRFAIDEAGNKWFIDYPQSLVKLHADDTTWTAYTNPDTLLDARADDIAIDASNNIWILGREYYSDFIHLIKFDGTNWTVYYDESESFQSFSPFSMNIDESNNIWIATRYDGVKKFDGTDWMVYDASNSGLPGNWIGCITIDEFNNKWIGTYEGLAVFNENGIVSVDDDKTLQVTIPNDYLLYQNYPNPFNPVTKIKYSVPQFTQVTIKVFDMLGNEIETLISEEKQAGTYEITWYAESLPSGIYFYRLQAGSFVETKKMVLMK